MNNTELLDKLEDTAIAYCNTLHEIKEVSDTFTKEEKDRAIRILTQAAEKVIGESKREEIDHSYTKAMNIIYDPNR